MSNFSAKFRIWLNLRLIRSDPVFFSTSVSLGRSSASESPMSALSANIKRVIKIAWGTCMYATLFTSSRNLRKSDLFVLSYILIIYLTL